MVCPYCNTRSIPNQEVCTHCGVILRDVKSAKRPSKPFPFRRVLILLIAYALGAIIVGVLGHFAATFIFETSANLLPMQVAFATGGAILGVLIVLMVSRGSVMIQSTILQNQRRKVHGQISKIEHEREKQNEQEQKELEENPNKEVNPESRLSLAALHLIEGQVDESLQQLEQAYKLGVGPRVDFLNNVGVAFARRGQLQLSLDRFSQAIRQNPEVAEPRLNLVYSLMRTGDTERLRTVLSEQNGSLSSAMEEPAAATRIGMSYAMTGDTANGVSYIERVIKRGEKESLADAHNDLGITSAMEKDYPEALEHFRDAVKADPGHAPAIANIGAVYYNQERYQDSLERFEAAIIVDPHHGMAHSLYGAALCKLDMHNDGIREFREAITHQANLFEPQFNLAKTYIEQGIPDQAERHLARAYEINPYSWQTLIAQAVLLFKQNQVEKSMDIYRQALQVRPGDPSILGGLGLCFTLVGEYDQAEHCFQEGLKADERDAEMLTNLSWHFLIRSDVENAVKALERSLLLDKKEPIANSNMGLCQMDMGAPDAAMGYFKTALQSDPSMGSVYYNMGNNFITQKAIESALDSWEKAKKYETGNADLHTNLGVAYYRKDDFEKASTEFRRVLMLRQERVEDYANAGITYARMKRHKEAIEQFEAGIQIDPMNAMLHSNLGLACFFANRVEEAMREWTEVTRVNAQYARRRGTKQQKEFDDTSIDYMPIYISERALYTQPKIPDYLAPYVPSYATAHYELMINDENLSKLETLKNQQSKIDRSIRSLKL